MIRLALTLFLNLFFQFGFAQVNKEYLPNTWMSIECVETDSFYNEYCGSKMIIEFNRDSLQLFYIYDKPISYQITEDNRLEYLGYKDIKILSLTKDTLRLDYFNSTLVFIPVPTLTNTFDHAMLRELLVNNEWTLNTYYNTENRYEFYDYLEDSQHYDYLKNKGIYDLEKINPGNYWSCSEIFWTVLTLNETTILFINPIDYCLGGDSYYILINDVTEDSISGFAWSDGEKFSLNLIKDENINREELVQKEKLLTTDSWELVDSNITIPELLHISAHFASIEIDTALILDSMDIVHKVLKYNFENDHTYIFLINNRVAAHGYWKFSKSGKILKLNQQNLFDENEPFLNKYIELDMLSEDELCFSSPLEIFSGNYSTNDYSFEMFWVFQKYKNSRK